MKSTFLSRRVLLSGGMGWIAVRRMMAQGPGSGITAAEVIERIRKNVGVPWREQTVDKIVAGTGETRVRGIATTMMATFDVVQRAAAAGKNMVITHEPTFWGHQDTTAEFAQNATYQAKAEFLQKNEMVVFRFHDHWHARRPDGIATGMVRDLGWEKNQDPQNPRQFLFPGTALGQLAKEMQSRLKIRTMRVVGDPKMAVKRVAAGWGYASQMPGIPMLSREDVDVLVVGETREWELVEYAQDAISAGKKKGLIVLGHVVSEQAGMKLCAEWLSGFVPEVKVEFVPAAEPFWSPDAL